MNPGRILIILGLLLLPYLPAQPFEKHYNARPSGRWNTLSTIHFDIYYPAGLEDRALRTAAIAESGYVLVADYLGYEIKNAIPVVVSPAPGDHHQCSFIHAVRTDPGNSLAVHSPYAILALFNGSYAEYRRHITHSLVHSFQLSMMSYGGIMIPKISSLRLPLWIAEGMADYIAGGSDGCSRDVMREPEMRGHPPGIRDLTEKGWNDAALSVSAGRAFFAFIERQYGRRAFGEMIRDFRDLGFLDDVIRTATGKSVEEIDGEWAEFMMSQARSSREKRHENASSAALASEGSAHIDLVPAVSPDGKRIAYLTDRDGLPVLKVLSAVNAGGKGSSLSRTIIDAGVFINLYKVNAMGNNIAWSSDANTVVIAGGSGNSQCLIFADAVTGRVRSKIILPFPAVLYPSMSRDGRYAVFTGIAANSEDLYLYTFSDGTITRLTDDAFSDRYPVFTPDGKGVIFASTWNSAGNIYNEAYSLYMIDLKTGSRVRLAGEGGLSCIQPDISADGKRMLYAAGVSGLHEIWMYEFDSKKNVRLADGHEGASHPRWFPGGKRYAYTACRGGGFELRVSEIGAGRTLGETGPLPHPKGAAYPDSYVNPAGYMFSRYNDRIRPEHLRIGADGTTRGSSVYLQLSLADTLSRHRLIISTNYMRESRNNDLNACLSYMYAYEGWDLGLSAFRQASPLPAVSLEETGDPLLYPGPGISLNGSALYGGALSASYPFCRFFTFSLRAEAGGYRRRFRDCGTRRDYSAGTGKLSASLEYNALLKGAMVPVSGFSGRVQADQFIDFNHGRTFTGAGIDMRYYAHPARQCVIALRGAGGTLLGRTTGDVNYRIGGYGSLRGFDPFSLSGKNMFLFNAELWLTPSDWMSFGMPLSGAAGNIGFVLFMDAGASWSGGFSMLNAKTGRFDDFKIDFGLGFRAAISPILIFALDFAWPFDRKSLKENVMIFSLGFDY